MKGKKSESRKFHVEALLENTESSALSIFLKQAQLEGRQNIDDALVTLGKIAVVCRALLGASPPQPPEYLAISHGWGDLYGKPIAVQTLKNGYRRPIKVWFDAFRELDDGRVRSIFDKAASSRTRFSELAVDTTIENQSQYISRLETRVKELQLEVNDLRHIAKQRKTMAANPMPVMKSPTASVKSETEVLVLSPLREWIREAGKPGSLISITEGGVELTQFARPGRTIMSRKVLDVLRSL